MKNKRLSSIHLSRETLRRMETGDLGQVAGGVSGVDNTVCLTNCNTNCASNCPRCEGTLHTCPP